MNITVAAIIIAVLIGVYFLRRESTDEQPTPSVTPTSTLAPTPSPQPSPTNGSGTPLDVSVDTSSAGFLSSCSLGTPTVPSLESSLVVSGGSGNYSISYGSCYASMNSNAMCAVTSIEVGNSTVTVSFPGTVYEGCPRESGFNDANYDIEIKDNVTGEIVNETLSVYWEVA